MTKDKSMCSGCRNNYYNGFNDRGIKECFSYKKAKIKKCIQISLYSTPPWDTRELKRLDCYCCDGYAILRNYDVIKKGKHKGKKCYAGSRYDWEATND